ncbi:MAG: hypothetical protein Q4C12_08190 [Clostridia bacterium]|nr:hypothetical protein [Clostridia bacterium]
MKKKKMQMQKKIFTAALALTAVFAACTVGHGAAVDDVNSSAVIQTDNSVAVSLAYLNPETDQQATLIVIPSGKSLTTLASEDIKYIAQRDVESGACSLSFELAAADQTGTYIVYAGGSGIDAPWSTTISYSSGYNIKGAFTMSKTDFSEATASATPASGGDAVNGTVDSDGQYIIVVSPATYNVTVGNPGYLYRIYSNVTVTDADVALGTFALLAGDVDVSGSINLTDIASLLENFGKDSASADWESIKTGDFDGSGTVNLADVSAALTAYGGSYTETGE